jgi:hypothetical protein
MGVTTYSIILPNELITQYTTSINSLQVFKIASALYLSCAKEDINDFFYFECLPVQHNATG